MNDGKTVLVTNGDEAAAALGRLYPALSCLPWRDVLHEGPVPWTESLEELSRIRAEFIAEQGWGERSAIEQQFRARDAAFLDLRSGSPLSLWFEDDLYDQLQLAQILAHLYGSARGPKQVMLTLVEGGVTEAIAENRFAEPAPLTEAVVRRYVDLWDAFRAPEPHPLEVLSSTEPADVLSKAVLRLCQEFPGGTSWLSRTELTALQRVAHAPLTPLELFREVQGLEEVPFMGDLVFWEVLRRLSSDEKGPLQTVKGVFRTPGESTDKASFAAQLLTLTPEGERVVSGEQCRSVFRSGTRWIGGVELSRSRFWIWDEHERSFYPDSVG